MIGLHDDALLPAAGEELELHWMSGDRIFSAVARVRDGDDESVRVVLDDPALEVALDDVRRVALHYEVFGVRYQARARPEVEEDAVTLRLVSPVRRRDNRLFPRATVKLKLVAKPARARTPAPGMAVVPKGEPSEVEVNLSASGLLAPLPFQAEEGSPVDLLLHLGDGLPPLAIQAEVAGQRDDGTALAFAQPGPHAQARLAGVVEDHYLSLLTLPDE